MSTRTEQLRNWLPLIALTTVWALLHLAALVVGGALDGDLPGTDPYMRLVRVAELINGGGWFDSVIDRSNAPFGDELHWSRPLDVLLFLLAAPLIPFVGTEAALLGAGIIVSPLAQLATVFVLIWAVTPVFGAQRARFSGIIFVGQPAVLIQAMPGRADHHSLQLLALALGLGLLLRLIDRDRWPEYRRYAVAAGAVAGFGIWVSPEMTIAAALATAVLGFAWLRDAISARVLRYYALGLTAVVAAALVFERLPADWFRVEYDKVSFPHLVVGFTVLLVALTFERIERRTTTTRGRLAAAGPVVAVLAGALLAIFPGLVEGPSADVDPRIIPIWLDHVSELRPLFPTSLGTFGWLLLLLGPALVTLPYLLSVSWRTRHKPESLTWFTLTLFFVGYFSLALWHVRFASFAGLVLAMVGGEIIGSVSDWARLLRIPLLRRTTGVIVALLFVVGFSLIGVATIVVTANAEASAESATECDLSAAARAIDAQPDSENAVIYAHIDFGPELLYRTDAAIVAGPYHRNAAGILDVYDFFSSTNLEHSRELAEARGARFAFVCDTPVEAGFFDAGKPEQSLYERLVSDDPPEWLSLVARGTEEQRFRLYEIRRK